MRIDNFCDVDYGSRISTLMTDTKNFQFLIILKTLLKLSTIFIEMSTRTENDMSDALDGYDTEMHARA